MITPTLPRLLPIPRCVNKPLYGRRGRGAGRRLTQRHFNNKSVDSLVPTLRRLSGYYFIESSEHKDLSPYYVRSRLWTRAMAMFPLELLRRSSKDPRKVPREIVSVGSRGDRPETHRISFKGPQRRPIRLSPTFSFIVAQWDLQL